MTKEKLHFQIITQTISSLQICKFCPFTTTRRIELSHHVNVVHLGVAPPKKCQYCVFHAVSEANMVRHVRERHGNKVTEFHSCEHCEYTTHK